MSFLNDLKENTNYGYTENGAIKHESTLNPVLDMFAMGGAYRKRTDKEVEELFGDAYRANKDLALKCLFYLRDVRGGQGERRFFRVAYKWLIRNDIEVARHNLLMISEFGRWDDLIEICYNTKLADDMAEIVKKRLIADWSWDNSGISLLAKWMPSENASSTHTKEMAKWFIKKFGWTPKEYRKYLSNLRKQINVLERLLSAKDWDKIEFDKIPSLAGLKYSHAFATREELAERYKEFMSSKKTKVNAAVANPVDIVDKVFRTRKDDAIGRLSIQKYWDNLKDYYEGREENAIAVVDVSGSMFGTPIRAAIGMGAYVAQKSHGPFANHFITFSSTPELVKFEGDDFYDKVRRCESAAWGMNTNIEAVMDLLLDTAKKNNCSQDELPARLYIFSDMEFDRCMTSNATDTGRWFNSHRMGENERETLFETIEKRWAAAGYKMPKVIFWNLDARQNNIPAIGDNFNYISGFSMSQMEAVMANKTAIDMMLEVLLSGRYQLIVA